MNKYTILLVDDNTDILMTVSSALQDKGYLVTTASSGEAALEVLDRKNFDLVITDLNMYEADGFTVSKRAKERNPNTGVIILTGNRETTLLDNAIRLGVDDYMFKPCKLSELWDRVAGCLENLRMKRYPESLAPSQQVEFLDCHPVEQSVSF